MSSNKRMCLRSDSQNSHSFSDCSINKFQSKVNYKRDSFDDRFCDDLCEDILQYLPLKDKLRFERVSKQFQRTVFVKQYSISPYTDECLIKHAQSENFSKEQYLKTIESVLKKCPNILKVNFNILESSIHIPELNNYEIHENIFQLITKYCNHLIEFNGRFIDSNEEEFKEFHKKFELKLTESRQFSYMEYIALFPNLQSLNLKTNVHLEQILQLNSSQLKSLYLIINEETENMVRKVLQKFHKIRHLTLSVNTDNQKSALNAFQDSPLLQNLIELKISENGSQRCVSIIKCLKQMAKKCPNLKKIEINYQIFLEEISDFEQLMSSLKAFPHLKRLDINLEFMSGLGFVSFKCFPQQLTHLSLGFNGKQLNVSILNDIVINLTKLQYFVYQTYNHYRRRRSDTNRRYSEPTLQTSDNKFVFKISYFSSNEIKNH